MKENDDRGSSVGPVSFSNHMHKSNHVLIVRNVLQVIFSTVLLLHYADTISSYKKFLKPVVLFFYFPQRQIKMVFGYLMNNLEQYASQMIIVKLLIYTKKNEVTR